jgi:hypothetical protein
MIQPTVGTSQAEISYSNSTDFGTTWNSETIISSVDSYASAPEDARITTSSANHVFVMWRDGKYGSTNGFAGSVMLRRSTNHGQMWNEEIRLTDVPSGIGQSLSCLDSLVAPVWHNEAQPFIGVSLRLSTDGGAAWQSELAVSDSSTQALYPDVAIQDAMIHVVWAKRVGGMPDQVYYRRGRIITTGVSERPDGVPYLSRLYQNYPNPFNSSTVVFYTLGTRSSVHVRVYDVVGRRVRDIVDETQGPGDFRIQFDGRTLSSGVYFLELHAGRLTLRRPMLLVK